MVAAVLGAIFGGLAVVVATDAIPRMTSHIMQNMSDIMREGGFDPAEM